MLPMFGSRCDAHWVKAQRNFRQQIRLITEVYTAFAGEKHQYSEKRKTDCIIKSKIFDRNEFLYKEWAAYQPLQRSGIISDHTIEKLKTSAFYIQCSCLQREHIHGIGTDKSA